MRGNALRWRLGIAAAGLIALALLVGGVGLVLIFDRVLDARTVQELDRAAKLIAGRVVLAPDGALHLPNPPSDPRFASPYGGLYWQVGRERGSGQDGTLRSRSLWDQELLPPDPGGEPSRGLALAGPDGGRLIAVERRLRIGSGDQETGIVILVALDRRELAASRTSYVGLLVPSLVGLGVVLSLAMVLFLRRALRPFRALRDDLRAVHEGRRTTLPTGFPDEVQPLVDDLNRLIAAQGRALERAQAQAGDMAHGLKTPLTVLTAAARREAAAHPGLSAEIEEQALAMSRRVERALARARITAGSGLRRPVCAVAPVVERLVRVLRRLPDGASLDWQLAVPDDLAYPGEEGDLTELLGNLLDNAGKWAHRRVRVSGAEGADGARVVIDDDGPGMSEEAMEGIARGRRWDESKPGTGFGIAISRDIAGETGARLDLGRSDLGGLRVTLIWPAGRTA